MALDPPTGSISTYDSVLDIEGSFVEHSDPVIPRVVWEGHLIIVWVDCFISIGRMSFRFVLNYFHIDGCLFGLIPFPCESVRRFAAGG